MQPTLTAKQHTQKTVPVDGRSAPRLQRRGAWGDNPQLIGQSEVCRNERLSLQPEATQPSSFPSKGPPFVHQVLRSPGQSLDSGIRAYLEPRFGHDFRRVRIHTDEPAASLAQSLGARAFTVGCDIAFAAGHYAPGSVAGRRLLAHELTHVVQQEAGVDTSLLAGPVHPAEREADANARASGTKARWTAKERPPVLAREAVTTVEVVPPTGPNVCGVRQHNEIAPAVVRGTEWLASAIRQLDAFIAGPTAPAAQAARNALDRHFHSTAPDIARQVRDRLSTLRTDLTSRRDMNVECLGTSDRSCNAAGAYVQGALLVFCPSFFGSRPLWQVLAIVHEMAHALVGGDHITDRAYQSDRLYPMLSTAEALTNAESFGLLVQELGSGRVQAITAPQDTFEDCPADWRPLIRRAIALAQRWNRNAQTATSDRRSDWLTGWTDLQTRYLGGTTPTALDAAKGIYDRVQSRLQDTIDFECEPEGGGRCDAGALTYWYEFWSDFHLCPAWKNRASDDDRAESMLAGLYGYLGGLGDSENERRRKLARLARELTARYWRSPT